MCTLMVTIENWENILPVFYVKLSYFEIWEKAKKKCYLTFKGIKSPICSQRVENANTNFK